MKHERSVLSIPVVLTVVCIFAACVLGVLLTGAGVHRRVTQRADDAYARRTAEQYITTRIRQADAAPGIHTDRMGDVSVLVFSQDIEDRTYLTYVYCYDGYLRELFVSRDYPFAPEDGEKLTALESAEFFLNGNALSVILGCTDGSTSTLSFHLRYGEVAP